MTATAGTLAEEIYRQRVIRDLTQAELAQRCKVSESTVRNWEHGRRLPGSDNLRPLARALRVERDGLAAMLADALLAKRNGHRNTNGR